MRFASLASIMILTSTGCSSASLSVGGNEPDAGPSDAGIHDAAVDASSDSPTAIDAGNEATSDTSNDAGPVAYTTYPLTYTDVVDGLDKSLHLRITAGGGLEHIVQLDTGSTGIVLPRSAVGAGATSYSPKKPFSITYTSSGRTFSGETMQAVVVIGVDAAGNTTGRPKTVMMDIGVADTASCATGYPSCTVPTPIDSIGMMGVGFARGAPPSSNPFLMLTDVGSATFWPGFLVTGTSLTLGLSPSLVAGFTPQALTAASTTMFDWGPATGCVSVTATPPVATSCGELLVDTGLAESIVQTATPPSALIDPTTGQLRSGVAVSYTTPSATSPALTYSFTTGATTDDTPDFVSWSDHLHDGQPFINTGRHLLANADIYFDAKNGAFGVRSH
jgi:hypothetical protein